jgi:hypothetical protein
MNIRNGAQEERIMAGGSSCQENGGSACPKSLTHAVRKVDKMKR